MQYYSSMTLSDYVAANWLEMDPNLVRLVENEASLLEDAREEAEAWSENYHDVHETARKLISDVSDVIFDIGAPGASLEEVKINLQGALENAFLEDYRR